MKKITNNTKKGVCLAIYLRYTLSVLQRSEVKLTTLQVQANNAVNTFTYLAGVKEYEKMLSFVSDIWKALSEKYSHDMNEDESTLFIEYLCMVLPPSAFKIFFCVEPYISTYKKEINSVQDKKMKYAVLEFMEILNKEFNTKRYGISTNQKSKKIHIKKTNTKKRKDKSNSSSVTKKTKNLKNIKKMKQRKEKELEKKKKLKEMIAKIKERTGDNNADKT